jgi:hypothetical protein
MISLCITHRVDEDISWVEDLYADLMIYNKGEEWDLPYPCLKAPKIKNEVDTFLRGIIESYDNLYRFKWVFFLRPNCKDYEPNVVSYLSINQYNQIAETKIGQLTDKVYLFNLKDVRNTLDESQNIVINAVVEAMNLLGINIDSEPYPCGVGSQYMVPSQYILNKPKDWWIMLHSIMFQLYEHLGDEISNIFEFLWPAIFVHTHNK